jgi:predicted regulator of Ras-like GTPase activity (Roadblock/LC7/MglB family)
MDDELRGLLEYEGVLSALATSPDGLVVAAAGLSGDDAEILGAAGSMLVDSSVDSGDVSGWLDAGTGSVHLMRDTEVVLVLLTESTLPHDTLVPVMRESLNSLSAVFV